MRAATQLEAGDPRLQRSDTTYLAVADSDGMMVSLIQSNYTGFGSGYVVPDLGFGLQNRGALFSLKPDSPNRLEPGKRPFWMHQLVEYILGGAMVATGLQSPSPAAVMSAASCAGESMKRCAMASGGSSCAARPSKNGRTERSRKACICLSDQ